MATLRYDFALRAGIGGILDAATGLLYVGNGEYYDPTTGRFLTRGVNPDSTNPYVPWNPVGAILGLLGVLSMFALRRRGKGNKNEPYMFLFIMLVVLPLSVGLACGTLTQPSNVLYSLSMRREPPNVLRGSLRARRTLFEGFMMALAEKTGRRPSMAERSANHAMDTV